MSARSASRAVLAVALTGGLTLVAGAILGTFGGGDRGLLPLGAAVFLATPLARNAVVLARDGRRVPRLLALTGTAALLAVYAWCAWRMVR